MGSGRVDFCHNHHNGQFRKRFYVFEAKSYLKVTLDLIDCACAVYQDEKFENHSQCVVTTCNQCIELFFHKISRCEFIAFFLFGGKIPDEK